MKTVFLLEHTHEVDEDIGSWDTKTLGIYSTKKEVKQAIQFYKTVPGFKDLPDDCFYLDEYELNMKEWTEGFITSEDSEERKKHETPEEIEYVKGCLRERIREKQEELKELQEELKKLQEDLNNMSESY